jgi:hypothetical protein
MINQGNYAKGIGLILKGQTRPKTFDQLGNQLVEAAEASPCGDVVIVTMSPDEYIALRQLRACWERN